MAVVVAMVSRRKFLTGAAAAVIAGPAAIKDGIALSSMSHPLSSMATMDLTEAALMQLVLELREEFYCIRGFDAYGESVAEMITIKVPTSGNESPLKLRQISPEEFYK